MGGIARRTGGVLLKIIEHKAKKSKDGKVDLKDLLQATINCEKEGFPLYAYDISPKGTLTSDVFWYDIQVLASTKAIEVISKNPHIRITSDGEKIAKNLEIPHKLNDVIAKL